MDRAAVITGIGLVTPAGIGVDAYWTNMLSGQSFITPITRFDPSGFTSKVAGSVPDFDPAKFVDPRIIVQTDRWTQFDLVSAQLALADAQLDMNSENPTRVGAVFAAGTGGNEFGQKQLHICWEKGPRFVSAYQSIAWFYAASIGQVSIGNTIRGYGRNICAEAAGGLMAFKQAANIIAHNICDVVFVGGSEAPISPYAFACYQASGLISGETGPYPYRPFDATRSGPVLGEGGAVFCVESQEHALQRDAHIYATIAGGGQTFDGRGIEQRQPESSGKGYARAMDQALAAAQLIPSDIDWVVCDGLGTAEGDIAEVRALQQVFGDDLATLPASAPKSMIGRLFNGGSPVDVASALLGMEADIVLPTAGFQQADPQCLINCVANMPQAARLKHILVGARGFGGFNASLVLSKWE